MMSSNRRSAVLAYILAALVVAADQALKYWVLDVYRLPDKLTSHLVGPLWLSLVWNRGFSFGILDISAIWTRWALSVFSLGVAAALAVWAWRAERPILTVAIGLIMGGAIGNVIDRMRFGAVTDFVDVTRLWFPWIFNLADSAITIGSVILIWDLFLAPRKGAG
jgi:signal peptidase II